MDRLEAANRCLSFFAADTSLSVVRGHVTVYWTSLGKPMKRRWQTHDGQDFYPTWYSKWCHGGTCSTALSQLVRWLQGKPVLPISTWRYWCSDKVHLTRDRGQELLAALQDGGYPEHAPCVLCGEAVTSLDWWSLNGVSGPCCGWTTGCRQKTKAV